MIPAVRGEGDRHAFAHTVTAPGNQNFHKTQSGIESTGNGWARDAFSQEKKGIGVGLVSAGGTLPRTAVIPLDLHTAEAESSPA